MPSNDRVRSRVALFLCLALAACGDSDREATDSGTDSGAGSRDGGQDGAPVAADGSPDARLSGDGATSDAGSPAGPSCIPFRDGECEAGTWCEPAEDLLSGTCIPSGSAGRLEACTETSDCAAGLLCVGLPDGTKRCETACDPSATGGSEGDTCSGTHACGNLLGEDSNGAPVVLDLGICVPSCDYDFGVPCEDPTLTCVPKEILSADFDLCLKDVTELDELADCDAAALPRLALCGPHRLCIDRADFLPGNLCYTVCRASAGALDETNHPDCQSPDDTCTTFAVGLGLCL